MGRRPSDVQPPVIKCRKIRNIPPIGYGIVTGYPLRRYKLILFIIMGVVYGCLSFYTNAFRQESDQSKLTADQFGFVSSIQLKRAHLSLQFLRWLIEIKWGYQPLKALQRNGFPLSTGRSTASKPPAAPPSSPSADFVISYPGKRLFSGVFLCKSFDV